MKTEWEYGWGCSKYTWALPLQITASAVNYGRQFGIGVRFLCFTLYFTKNYAGYPLDRSRLPSWTL